jgi:hypothetical protein
MPATGSADLQVSRSLERWLMAQNAITQSTRSKFAAIVSGTRATNPSHICITLSNMSVPKMTTKGIAHAISAFAAGRPLTIEHEHVTRRVFGGFDHGL